MFKDKVVIITGASSGIGRALAIKFAEEQNHIVLAARNIEKLNEVNILCQSKGADTIVVPTDVTIEKNCENLINRTIEKFGRIDILINNAGISMRALFGDVEIDVLKKLLDVNFWGTVYCSKYAYPHLLKVGGTLVGVISIAGFRGLPARSGYSAAKYAVYGFLETVRAENYKTGLKVLIVAPGFTESNIRNTALTKNGTPQKESPIDEKKLMSSQKVAKKTIRAIKRRKRLCILTLEGWFIYWLRVVIPLKIFDGIVYRRLSKEADSPFK